MWNVLQSSKEKKNPDREEYAKYFFVPTANKLL